MAWVALKLLGLTHNSCAIYNCACLARSVIVTCWVLARSIEHNDHVNLKAVRINQCTVVVISFPKMLVWDGDVPQRHGRRSQLTSITRTRAFANRRDDNYGDNVDLENALSFAFTEQMLAFALILKTDQFQICEDIATMIDDRLQAVLRSILHGLLVSPSKCVDEQWLIIDAGLNRRPTVYCCLGIRSNGSFLDMSRVKRQFATKLAAPFLQFVHVKVDQVTNALVYACNFENDRAIVYMGQPIEVGLLKEICAPKKRRLIGHCIDAGMLVSFFSRCRSPDPLFKDAATKAFGGSWYFDQAVGCQTGVGTKKRKFGPWKTVPSRYLDVADCEIATYYKDVRKCDNVNIVLPPWNSVKRALASIM